MQTNICRKQCSKLKHIHIMENISEKVTGTSQPSQDCLQLCRKGGQYLIFPSTWFFQLQVLHWCDLPPCVPLLPGCLGPGGCPGSEVWRRQSYALSNRFNGNDKMTFIYIGVFSVINTIKLLRYLVHIGMSQVTPRSIQFCVFSISSSAINLPR